MQPHLAYNFENILDGIQASIYWKDKKGKYIGVNNMFTDYLYASTVRPDDIVGHTDRDFIWVNEAPQLEKNDREVIYTENSKSIIEPCKCVDKEVKFFVSHKTPLRSRDGKILGVFGISYLLGKDNLVPANLQIFNHSQSVIDEKINSKLTMRQLDCLYHLVKGCSIKQIAKELSLSPRTVEHYIDAIKQKLNCESRVELISLALKLPAIKNRFCE